MSANRVLFVNLAVVAVSLLSSPVTRAASSGDLLSSAKYLWYFDTDVNGNGVLDVDDVRDVRDWGSTAPDSYAGRGKPALVSGKKESTVDALIRWRTGDVVSPEQGVVDASRYLDMITTTNVYPGSVYQRTITHGFKMPGNSAWKGDISAVARVNVASFTGWPMLPKKNQDSATRSWLISNGFTWYSPTDIVGFTLGFCGSGYGYDPALGTLVVNGYGMGNVAATGVQLATNVWYDVAWSVKFNGDKAKVSFVVISEKSDVWMQEVEKSGVSIPDFHAGSSPVFSVGGLSVDGPVGVGDAQRFSGCLSRLAVWDKALTQDELLSVMTQPRPWFELGSANGSGEEFGLASEANYTYEIEKAPWHAMPRSLSDEDGKRALTLVAPYHLMSDGAPVEEFAVPYSFEVLAAADSGSATLALTVQGKAIGEPQTISAGGLAKWYVPANTLTADDVAHTIVLTRTGGSSGAFVFDKISMTGSFAFGRKNWKTDEFAPDNGRRATNYVGMRNMSRVNIAPNQAYCTVSHRFFAPADQAGSRSYTVEAMAYGFGAGGTPAPSLIEGAGFSTGRYPFCLKLNGELIYAAPEGLGNGTVFKVELPRGKVKAGWNTFSFAPYDDDFYNLIYKQNYWWMGFDYFKMSMSKEHFGGLLIVR